MSTPSKVGREDFATVAALVAMVFVLSIVGVLGGGWALMLAVGLLGSSVSYWNAVAVTVLLGVWYRLLHVRVKARD